MRQVDAESHDGCATGRGAPDKDRTVPAEMPGPFHPAGVEEPGLLMTLGVDAAQVRTFVMVVGETGESQIAGDGLAAVLLGDDVIDLEPGGRKGRRKLQPDVTSKSKLAS